MGTSNKTYSLKAHIWSGHNNEQEINALDIAEAGFQPKIIFGSRIVHVPPTLEAGLSNLAPQQKHHSCFLVTFLRKRDLRSFHCMFYSYNRQPLSVDAILATGPPHPSDCASETQCTV